MNTKVLWPLSTGLLLGVMAACSGAGSESASSLELAWDVDASDASFEDGGPPRLYMRAETPLCTIANSLGGGACRVNANPTEPSPFKWPFCSNVPNSVRLTNYLVPICSSDSPLLFTEPGRQPGAGNVAITINRAMYVECRKDIADPYGEISVFARATVPHVVVEPSNPLRYHQRVSARINYNYGVYQGMFPLLEGVILLLDPQSGEWREAARADLSVDVQEGWVAVDAPAGARVKLEVRGHRLATGEAPPPEPEEEGGGKVTMNLGVVCPLENGVPDCTTP